MRKSVFMANKEKKDFFLLRVIKKIFVTGLIHILPTLLVVSILVIAYNFLDKSIGGPINHLIKRKLAGNWKQIAIQYLKIDPDLYRPSYQESFEELVRRVQRSSVEFNQAKLALDEARKSFEKQATPLLQKKEMT